ncbi:uncharacterized protein LOC114461667 isoform X3 [Gouania willdenowi]|uniref:uncharacterized protein LOC114458360 isoform X3 n=1 Tax=Gouania willdenowi TaxID=441366 RepID=UPI001055624C|nr:uncharacterized protein LOC114458360 isoform X3 [Gouania willdenowi]XP_028299720.1 uncharacterized protein LOC114461667 isoform X3 [Gouania willdenowi]
MMQEQTQIDGEMLADNKNAEIMEPLMNTDSMMLNEEMAGEDGFSHSSSMSSISTDEYVPESSEDSSEESPNQSPAAKRNKFIPLKENSKCRRKGQKGMDLLLEKNSEEFPRAKKKTFGRASSLFRGDCLVTPPRKEVEVERRLKTKVNYKTKKRPIVSSKDDIGRSKLKKMRYKSIRKIDSDSETDPSDSGDSKLKKKTQHKRHHGRESSYSDTQSNQAEPENTRQNKRDYCSEEDLDEPNLKKTEYKHHYKSNSHSKDSDGVKHTQKKYDKKKAGLRSKSRYMWSMEGDLSSQEDEIDEHTSKRHRNRRSNTIAKNEHSQTLTENRSLVVGGVPEVRGQKKYHEKKNYCLFCYKPQSKIARHLERKHPDETEVASVIILPKKSKQRRIGLDLLRKQGNRTHNIETLQKGKGTLVACKRQSNDHSIPADYQHCFACFGLYKRKYLWKHAKQCSLAVEARKCLPGKTRIQTLCAGSQPVPKEVNKKVWALVNGMTQDNITQAIKEDSHILKVGEKMYNRQRQTASQHNNIRQIMRGLGRLLIQGRRVTPLKKMEDYIHPKNFHHVIRAVKKVTGFNENGNKFDKPTFATKLGQSVQRVADIIEAEALASQNNDKKVLVQEFRRMYCLTWNEMISSAAYRTLEEKKWNKPKLIPLADDVKRMHMCMAVRQKDYNEQLLNHKTPKNWSNLAKVTLAQVILFNRRREGEVSNMKLETYVGRDRSPLNKDVAEALSEVEKKLCQHFERVEIRGKRGRRVPIILTPTMVQSLDLLVKERSSCGVGNNSFLFARPGYDSRQRGSDCIRELARSCGAHKPEAFSSTKLRRQVATLSRVLNLNDSEQDLFADFLGHDIRVHRKFYRLPEGTLQLAKISKVLMACEQGRLADFKGKGLDQISITPHDGSHVIEESSGMSSEDDVKADSTGGTSMTQNQEEHHNLQLDDEQRVEGKTTVTEIKKVAVEQELVVDSCSSKATNKTTKIKWSLDEVQAVERSLLTHIRTGRTPGKVDCERCIAAADGALSARDWRAVKFYVRNRIVSESRL